MAAIADVLSFLEQYAPPRHAEQWDNVGLLVGDRAGPVRRVMTCLTITTASAAEAIQRQASLIVTHHPLPFHPLKRLTSDTTTGRLLWDLIRAGVAVYSAHTAFDSAVEGINQRLAEGLGLVEIGPLVPVVDAPGVGRQGRPAGPLTLGELADRVKKFLAVDPVQLVGDPGQSVGKVAIACGAAGELLEAAQRAGCDAMLLGETRFHTLLEAEALGIGMVLPGHFASERFAMERLAEVLARQFTDLEVWASQDERDPIRYQ